MSKKKKDGTDEPKKTKAKRSSKKELQKNAVLNNKTPASAVEPPAPLMPRRAIGGRNKTAALSTHDVALRAYFIAERRRNLDLAGDEMGDWVEAERQLRTEANKKST